MRRLPAAPIILAALALGGCSYADSLLGLGAPSPPKPEPPAAAAPAPAPPAASAAPSAPASETRKPFVVIRFEGGPPPDYAQGLYAAMSGALERRPGVAFDLVAVTRDPDSAERNLTTIFRTITGMGMPAERLSLSAAAAADEATDEVWIYVR
ncbi:MAG TPA: hypothetical protein VN802_09750 [Stellaceae bacterium]|nr:hypothetical protein [Stellaceae bacterium]